MIIDTSTLDLDKAAFERILRGYRVLQSSSQAQSDPDLAKEINEGIANNERDLANTNAILASVAKWESDGTPLYKREIASQSVIDALKRIADEVALVPLDFETPELLSNGGTIIVE